MADEIIHCTNTSVEQESGDVAGYVVILSDGEPLPSISLSWSEGALMLPVAAKITDYDRMSGRLAFSVHIEWGDLPFFWQIDRTTGKTEFCTLDPAQCMAVTPK